jgi:hypothetical protein
MQAGARQGVRLADSHLRHHLLAGEVRRPRASATSSSGRSPRGDYSAHRSRLPQSAGTPYVDTLDADHLLLLQVTASEPAGPPVAGPFADLPGNQSADVRPQGLAVVAVHPELRSAVGHHHNLPAV